MVNATLWQLYPRQRNPVPIIQETGWAPASEWTGAENLPRTEIRFLDYPACSESLYRLRCLVPFLIQGLIKLAGVSTRKFKFPVERTFLQVGREQLFRARSLSSTTAMLVYRRGIHGICLAQNGHKNFRRLGLCQPINIMTDCQ